jgi:hypothetical protein
VEGYWREILSKAYRLSALNSLTLTAKHSGLLMSRIKATEQSSPRNRKIQIVDYLS